MTSENKLQSLQGLRGISIILVLIFHLYPREFVNGFVGVDMFFVLSGYLMTKILTRKFNFLSVVNFYKKRFSRIVPLYYFTIIGTIIGVLCLVLKAERQEFLLDVKWCLSLVSNFQPIFEHKTYWDQVSTIRFLTHLWSLATELQYYLMVPIIHWIAINLPFYNRIFGYSLAIVILFFFQLLTPFELSYCFLAARVWQFLLGSVAFELYQRNGEADIFKKKNETKWNVFDIFSYLFIGILGTVLTLPWIFGEHSTRLQPLVFIGDISYVTYLVHWPIINFVRYIQQKDAETLSIYGLTFFLINFKHSFLEAVLSVVIIFALSLLVHYCLEKQLLKLDFFVNLSITLLIIAACVALLPWTENQECFAMKTLPDTITKQLEFNSNPLNILTPLSELRCDFNETTANLTIQDGGIEYCSHKGNGTGRVLVIGNSLSIRAFLPIFKLFDGNYEEIRLFARHASAPLLNFAPFYTEAAVDMAREMNPDLIWIVQGMNEILFHGSDTSYDFSPQSLDRVIQNTMDQFKGLTKMVFVDLPYFITDKKIGKLIPRSMVYRKSLEEYLSVSLVEVENQLEEQRERLLNLNCTNCYFNDVQKALTNGEDRFYLYDKETYRPLIYDGSHIGLAGFERIQPLYKQRINQFYESLKLGDLVS
uniref:Acyl_transf_3 domain-containing protein n=1 Tax=Caenorhabditis tropicalis TaxID=1561998 RepID=A0A1I7TQS1_9PELO